MPRREYGNLVIEEAEGAEPPEQMLRRPREGRSSPPGKRAWSLLRKLDRSARPEPWKMVVQGGDRGGKPMTQKNGVAGGSPVSPGQNGRAQGALAPLEVSQTDSSSPTLVVENQAFHKVLILQLEKAVGRTGQSPDAGRSQPFFKETLIMLRLTIVFLVLAMIAAFFGYGGVANYSWEGARTFFFVFLVLALLALVNGSGFFRRSD
jgi:uncharacterized membrane protein YtjA (UPF0391 family)